MRKSDKQTNFPFSSLKWPFYGYFNVPSNMAQFHEIIQTENSHSFTKKYSNSYQETIIVI